MERRNFLRVALVVAAGVVGCAMSAQAAPMAPQPLTSESRSSVNPDAHRAVTTANEVEHLVPQQVRWHRHWRHRHWGWRHRHWRWHHRHWGWRHRHWGWRHRHWHHRHW
jgi:hypothetical protein